ncbi:hypothetical protein CBR_g21867 [Chara braunii]|uniref:Uncharacterized protein n=1 Tax=Chara braunii TaxID=69332 RepID=A0A388L1J3_CHABU|nr:hypothetical protein CBR_g21867 [Chara braunii]|eukprot:GBG76118.1 hypothetical protein CBR_g21867 [Chara braunii]
MEYRDLALNVPKERPILRQEYVFRLLPTHEGSSSLAQETPVTTVGHESVIHDTEGQGKGHTSSIQTQVGPDAPGNTSGLHSPDAGTHRVGTPKILKFVCQGETYSLRDEARRESGSLGQEVGGNEVEGMGAVRDSSRATALAGADFFGEDARATQKTVREEVAEQTQRMKRMKGHLQPMIDGDEGDVEERASGKRTPGMRGGQEQGVKKRQLKQEGATTSKKAKRPGGLIICEGQAMGEGDSVRLGIVASREPSEKSKRKLAAEEGDGQKKPMRRKTAEGTSGGKRAVGRQYDEVAAFWLEYERNDDGEIVENELPIQLLIDPRKSLADMTDAEKLSILDDILPLRGVFVQSAGGYLKRQHKPEIKDMVATRKVDRVMLRIFHYILFLEYEEDSEVWRYGSQFFRTEEHLLAEFAPRGLTNQVLAELRKHFQGAVEYVNTCKCCPPYWESLDETKKMYDDERFPKSFEKSIRSILRTEEEVQDTIRVNGNVRHIKCHKINRVTSLIPFNCPTSLAHTRLSEIREIVRHYVCNLYVLDLCDPTLLSNWQEDNFASLQGVLQTLSPRHWALVVFFPSRWELSFLKGMPKLSVHHVRTGKWVRHAQKKSNAREGNMLVEEYDRLYMVFNGDNQEDNTVAVFPANSPSKPPRANAPSPAKPTTAARSKVACSSDPSGQAVACFDVADEDKFPRSQWEDDGVTSVRGAAYGGTGSATHCGRTFSSVVWKLLRSGRNVVALEDEAKMIDYLCKFVKTRVRDPRRHCSFVQTTDERNWDPKRDMYWKLSEKKRTEVWEFLFLPGPPAQTDLEYNRRRNLVFGVLNGYHDAPRESFDEEDPFDAEDMEEMSDSETFDFESMPLPRVVAQVDDEGEGVPRRYSTSPAGLKRVFECETVKNQSSDDGEEERDYDYVLGDKLPRDHDTQENDMLFFYGKHHWFPPEDVWGHNVVWHPRKFQPAVKTGKWVMAMRQADGKWSGMNRLGAGPFEKKARKALVEHLRVMNPNKSLPDVNAYAGQKLDELYAKKMSEFRAPFYALKTALSRGIHWRMPQPPSGGQHPGGGRRGDGGDGAGPGGGGDGGEGSGSGGDEAKGKGPGETSKRAADPGEEELSQGAHAVNREEETQHWPPSRVLDDLDAGVFKTGASGHLRPPSEGASDDLESKSTPLPGEGELSQEAHAVQREEETQHWPPNEVREGLDAGAFETNASEHQCHASEGASIDVESKSAAALGEEYLSQEAHAVQRDVGSGGGENHGEGSRDSNTRDEAALGSYEVRVDSQLSVRTLFHNVEDSPRRSTQHDCPVQDDTLLLHLFEEGERLQRAAASVQGPAVGVLETEASECEGDTLEETHAVQQDE